MKARHCCVFFVMQSVLLARLAGAATLEYDSSARATGTVNSGSVGTGGTQQGSNERNLSVSTLFSDNFANESFDSASVKLDDGVVTASDHACSGGNATAAGTASAGGFVSFNQNYIVMSSTLAIGTIVPVHFQLSSSAMIFAKGSNLDNFNDGGGSGAHVQFSLGSITAADGSHSKSIGFPQIEQDVHSGNFDPDGGNAMIDFNLAVGDIIRLSVAADATAGSTAIGLGEIDGHGQLAVTWGFSVTGDALLSIDDTKPMPAPPYTNGSKMHAMESLPPIPPTLDPSTPEPTSFNLLAVGGIALLPWRRR